MCPLKCRELDNFANLIICLKIFIIKQIVVIVILFKGNGIFKETLRIG
jgi:hypothetical protein